MLNIIIMAGGLGKRMKSDLPKVLHKVSDIPMIVRIIQEALKCNPQHIFIVVVKYKPIIQQTIHKYLPIDNIIYVNQSIPKGTGHAIQCCVHHLTKLNDQDQILILSGDVPLITSDIMLNMKTNKNAKILTTIVDQPFGYGRICNTNTFRIIEEKDCTDIERKIKQINCGIYLFKNKILYTKIQLLKNNNAQHEYYLTDIFNFITDIDVHVLSKDKQHKVLGINTKQQLENINNMLTKVS